MADGNPEMRAYLSLFNPFSLELLLSTAKGMKLRQQTWVWMWCMQVYGSAYLVGVNTYQCA